MDFQLQERKKTFRAELNVFGEFLHHEYKQKSYFVYAAAFSSASVFIIPLKWLEVEKYDHAPEIVVDRRTHMHGLWFIWQQHV